MLKEKLKTIPHLPGSYQMRNINNNVIYVGKAKDLYKRVNSYFKGNVTGKTAKMVSEVHDFTYITTQTEQEAFILEIRAFFMGVLLLDVIIYAGGFTPLFCKNPAI